MTEEEHKNNAADLARSIEFMEASGAEAVDNAIGGHGIASVVVDEAAGLPDVMVGVNVPEGNHPARAINQGLNSDRAAEGNHHDDAFEVWIYRKVGTGFALEGRAQANRAEDAFLYAFTEMNDATYKATLPARDTHAYYERLYHVLRDGFTKLTKEGFDPIEINASACGMARRSMEAIVGRKKAIEWDNFVRKQIGWDKAQIIYPNQVVKDRRGKS